MVPLNLACLQYLFFEQILNIFNRLQIEIYLNPHVYV